MKKLILLISTITMSLAYGASPGSLYKQSGTTLAGKVKQFEEYRGKVLLVVNTASGCGYTGQLGELQKLQDKFKDTGFEVLGFPSNDFKQEKMDGEKLATFCKRNYGVKFTMFKKSSVNGPERNPIYSYLVNHSQNPQQDISWNFEKFLVARDGKVLGRYKSSVGPLSKQLVSDIQKASTKKSTSN